MEPQRRRRSFLSGFLTGLALALVSALALALLFPPTIYAPPDVAPEADRAPGNLASPGSAPAPGGLLGAPAQNPVVAPRPASEMPQGLEDLARPAAPDVFQGGDAGSPSLFPQQQE